MKRVAGAALALVALVAVGIMLAALALSNAELRRWVRVPLDAPDPIRWIAAASSEMDPRIVPLDQMKGQSGPNPFKRPSWEGIDGKSRPADPRTDPKRGTTQTMFLHTRLETRLSSMLRRARLPNKVLRIGITIPATRPRASANLQVRARQGAICFMEIDSRVPPCRPDIEETVDRAVQIAFDTLPLVDEVDVVVVPWRTVQGMKPPILFSVFARRSDWFGVAGARSHMENLRTAGAVWVDPHVMSDVVIPPQRLKGGPR